jgi:hypothetical protein
MAKEDSDTRAKGGRRMFGLKTQLRFWCMEIVSLCHEIPGYPGQIST